MTAVAYLLRRVSVGAFPRSPDCLAILARGGESPSATILRVRRTLAKLAPADRARLRLVVLRRSA